MNDKEAKKLLDQCLEFDDCDSFVKFFMNLIRNRIGAAGKIYGKHINAQETEDLIQEVFEKLFKNDRKYLRDFKFIEDGSFSAWIARIAGNTTKNFLRKKGYDSFVWKSRQDMMEDNDEDGGNIKEKFIFDPTDAIERQIILTQILPKLSTRDQLIIKLYRKGLASKQIADTLDTTEAHINRTILTIKNKLKKMCSKE